MEQPARKRFGQNFLRDQHTIDRIVRKIAAGPADNLVEIGPGKGALTAPLLVDCPKLQAIEIDRDLIPGLLAQFARYPGFTIHQQNALKFDFASLLADQPGERLRIVGNLPYNISTPLIFHLLSFQHQIHDMHFMLQKEVVERLAATPGSCHYGRLSVMVQYHCRVDPLLEVPPECFHPRPKVRSAVVRLMPFRQVPFRAGNFGLFRQLVNTAFQQRRKTLRNSLKGFLRSGQADLLPVDTGLRPENLSVSDYVDLSNQLHALADR